jgi:hypothetical protein
MCGEEGMGQETESRSGPNDTRNTFKKTENNGKKHFLISGGRREML